MSKRKFLLLPIGTRVIGIGVSGEIVRRLHCNNGWHYRVKWDGGSSSVERVGRVGSGWHVTVDERRAP